MSKKLAGENCASQKLAGSLAGDSKSQAGLADFQNFQISLINDNIQEDNVSHSLQLSSGCHFAQEAQGRDEDVPFLHQPQFSGSTEQCPGVSHLHVVPDTLTKSVTPAVEVVIHVLPVEVVEAFLAFGQALFQACMAPLAVGHSCDQAHLPTDVFSSLDLDVDVGVADMAPLEYHLAYWPSLSPHPSLDATQATSGKHSVVNTPLPQAPPLPKHAHLAPCTAGSANAPVIMGPPQSLAGCTPKVADYSWLTSDEDWRMMAIPS